MAEIDFMGGLHRSTKRDYLARVNNKEYPKAKAAEVAKLYDYDYWDGDRNICYGGYRYISGRWHTVIQQMLEYYEIKENARILDIGCGKGYFLYDFKTIRPDVEIAGIDISGYALRNAREEVKDRLIEGCCTRLPWDDDYFDLVVSMTTLHNLENFRLEQALKEMERVGKDKYLCVESYRNEEEKANLLYWQVTCEAFNKPEEWQWWFNKTGYTGDYSFIYFE